MFVCFAGAFDDAGHPGNIHLSSGKSDALFREPLLFLSRHRCSMFANEVARMVPDFLVEKEAGKQVCRRQR
jgi:hypothetical protein